MTFGALGERDARDELAAADLGGVALDADARAGRAHGAADLHRGALHDGGVDGGGDLELHRLLRFGRGRVRAAAAEEGAREAGSDQGSEPHRPQPGYRPP